MDVDGLWSQLQQYLQMYQALSVPGLADSKPSASVMERCAELVNELGEEAIKGKKIPAVPTRKEVFRLIRAAPPVRDRLIIRLLYASGLRVGELVALKKADVRPSERTLFVRSGKGDKDRYVCIDPRTMRMLGHWMTVSPEAEMVLDIEERQVARVVKKYGQKLGLVQKYEQMGRSFSPHSLRHSMATHCYENGMDLFTLRKLLGHEFLSTTEMYIETAMKRRRRVYRRTHELCLRREQSEPEGRDPDSKAT